MLARSTKPNRCRHCRERMPLEQARHVIHQECIQPFVDALKAKKERKERSEQRARAKVERATTRARKAAIKTIPDLIKEAQVAFNAFIRERDKQAGHPDISTGKPLDWAANGVDAGHYRSVGAASHLRFDERNCHAQSKSENRYRAGNVVAYRYWLVRRIGIESVESLEADNTPHKWTRGELIAIKEKYRAKLRALKEKTE